MNIALLGYGRMGREIESVALARGHSISARFDASNPAHGSGMNGDVAIDFSGADQLFYHVSLALDNSMPLVIGTTGWNEQLPALRVLVEQVNGSVVYGSNFSIGMQIFQRIVQRAAQLINVAESYDIALHEVHHNAKLDSPSGTALSLAERILQEVERKTAVFTETSHGLIEPQALHLSSTRVGAVAGTHTVLLDSEADTISLEHRAKNRGGFALGAVLAAEWIVANPGFHEFSEVFDQVLGAQRG